MLLALALSAPAAAGAATGEAGAAGALTPELETLATPAVASASAEEQAEAVGLPAEGPGSLSREGERVVVEAHFEEGAIARLEALEQAGAKVLTASRAYQDVALSAEPDDLESIAEVPGLDVVVPSRRPIIYATGGATTSAGGTSECEGGSVISQGVAQLNVPAAREAFGVQGKGITVGVLSDSFDSATESIEGGPVHTDAAQDEATNDLPGPASSCAGQQVPVRVIAEAPSSGGEFTDEGRAMLQVVHDVAPEAELAFATAYSSELEFAANIEKLAKPVRNGGAGAKVIVDDVAYFTEPFYQDGPVANAIRKVTEAGVTYLTAAGNDNLIEAGTGREFASWESDKFRDTTCPGVPGTKVAQASSSCMNFSPTATDPTYGITVGGEATLTVDLQWAEPWYGLEADLNAYLLNPAGEVIGSEEIRNVGSGAFAEPVALLSWRNASSSSTQVQLVVDRCIHTCNAAANVSAMPRLKVALMEDGSGVTKTEYPQSDPAAGITVGPTIFGHAGSTAAITLGAVRYSQSRTSPREPERYSSRGPVLHYFGPVNGTTAAAALPEPELISKPNLTATDCASTTFFAQLESDNKYHFCGTSEAAPHAAAVAALMKESDPLVSPQRIREAMEESATPFTVVTSCEAVGAGLLNADAALGALESISPAEAGCKAELPPEEESDGRGTEGEEGGSEEEGGGEEGGGETPTTPTPSPGPTPVPASPPVVTLTRFPGAVTSETRPTFEFSSSKAATFTCRIDGIAQACSSPYVVPGALGDGTHGFAVTATDSEGRSASTPVYYFTVDTKAPRARIVAHPRKLVKTRRRDVVARFRLGADVSPVTYYCQIDREPLRVCGARLRFRLPPGRHELKVRAKDELGNLSLSPTTYQFRIKELRR